MKKFFMVKNDEGFVLILSLMILLVLSLMGVAGNNTAITEMLIAGNDSVHKQTFYSSDARTEVSSSVVEENIACITGFTVNDAPDTVIEGMIRVYASALNLWQKPLYPSKTDCWNAVEPDSLCEEKEDGFYVAIPADTNRDMFYPNTANNNQPHTNITVGGKTEMTTGSALQMAAGYEGKGKGIGSGGAHLLYDIYSQHVGLNNSEVLVHVEWRHTIGQEGECFY